MRPLKAETMTDLDVFARGVALARKASRARLGREFTAEEYPQIIAALFAGERLVCGLFEASIAKEATNASSSTSDDPHP